MAHSAPHSAEIKTARRVKEAAACYNARDKKAFGRVLKLCRSIIELPLFRKPSEWKKQLRLDQQRDLAIAAEICVTLWPRYLKRFGHAIQGAKGETETELIYGIVSNIYFMQRLRFNQSKFIVKMAQTASKDTSHVCKMVIADALTDGSYSSDRVKEELLEALPQIPGVNRYIRGREKRNR